MNGTNKGGEEIAARIQRLKADRGALILAHTYQSLEVQDLADFVGDSLELSRKAAETDAPIIVFCGVRFMAETAKVLSPDRMVLLPAEDAGCPMADSLTAENLLSMKRQFPGLPVVTYINSTADVKAESDWCCTSANALRVVEAVPADELLCVPDKNLAQWCQKNTSKKIHWWNGGCPVHMRMTRKSVVKSKEQFPDALLLAHPECNPDVLELADAVLSTSQILAYARTSPAKRFLIATEAEVVLKLRQVHPDKEFYSAGPAQTCVNMKKTRPSDIERALETLKPAVDLEPELLERAKKPIDRMLSVR